MTRLLTTALALSLCAASADAQSFRAENRVTVNPLPSGQFEVIEGGEHGARSIWCAAADYAQTRLGASGVNRLVVAAPRGNAQTAPGRKGVAFTLAPRDTGASVSILGTSIRTPGASLRVAHADQFCYDRLLSSR
ncbi:MAG: hypothetical protein AAF218_00495 [Pseudomonadota bacterium]